MEEKQNKLLKEIIKNQSIEIILQKEILKEMRRIKNSNN